MSKNSVSDGICLSHSRRIAMPEVEYPRHVVGPYEVRVMEQVVENGRVFKRAVRKTVDPSEKFKGLKASDFALENVIAVGALGSLKDCRLGYNSIGEISDGLEDTIDAVIGAVNAAESNPLND